MASAAAGLVAADGGDCGGEGDVANERLIGPNQSGAPVEVQTHAAHGEADSFGGGCASRCGKHGESADAAEADRAEIDDEIGSSGFQRCHQRGADQGQRQHVDIAGQRQQRDASRRAGLDVEMVVP
jgi:hypothetical protein